MSIVPYNLNNRVLYHDPNHGILVLHNNQQNTFLLLSTNDLNHNHSPVRRQLYPKMFPGGNDGSHETECPNCGFKWTDYPATRLQQRRSSESLNGLMDLPNFQPEETNALYKPFSGGFMHHDYFKLLGKMAPGNSESIGPIQSDFSIPEDMYIQDYFKRFFKKVPPYVLGSGAHAQVYKVVHVLNEIKLGVYAVKRISVGDKFELLSQVLNEVLILYELSVKGANENNLIRYNHVWLELGDIEDLNTYFLSDTHNNNKEEKCKKIPYVFILQQYCDGGHLEDLIVKNFQVQSHLSWKEKIDIERMKRRSERGRIHVESSKTRPWLSEVEIWKFSKDVAKGVHYLHLHGILHRDLKPSNCLLESYYENKELSSQYFPDADTFEREIDQLPKVLVSDFGECQIIDKHSISEQTISLEFEDKKKERQGNTGTLEFTAPELWLYSNFDPTSETEGGSLFDFTYESDIYSLGLIFCYLCVGALPFTENIVNENDPQLVRKQIFDWYIDLTPESFHAWFLQACIHAQGSRVESSPFITHYEQLIYMMIKNDGSKSAENPTNRISSRDVLRHLELIKNECFMKSDLFENNEPSESTHNQSDDELDFEDEATLNLIGDVEAENNARKLSQPVISTPKWNISVIWYLIHFLILEMLSYPYTTRHKLWCKMFNIFSFLLDYMFMPPRSIRVFLLAVNTSLVLWIAANDQNYRSRADYVSDFFR
jgi:serine/threonine protein kinase